MEKQANLTPELREMQTNLQMKFSAFDHDQRSMIANYLNMYNTTAWLYNEILSEDERTYVDLSMQYVLETQRLDAMVDKTDQMDMPEGIQSLVDNLNNVQ